VVAGTTPADDGEKIMQNPLALRINEVCAASRIGRTRVYEAIKRGELRARKNGKSTLVLHADLVEWLNGLPSISPKSTRTK
jgi:excisionase family DNA binding protein